MAKTVCWIWHKKWIQVDKSGDKGQKVLYKLMNTAIYGKTMENMRNRIDKRVVSIKRFKWATKPQYMLQKIFNNNVDVIGKSKLLNLTNQYVLCILFHASTCATSLMCIKNSVPHFCL